MKLSTIYKEPFWGGLTIFLLGTLSSLLGYVGAGVFLFTVFILFLRPRLIIVFIFTAIFLFSIFRTELEVNRAVSPILSYINTSINVEGVVIRETQTRDTSARYYLRVEKINDMPVLNTRVIVRDSSGTIPVYGDIVSFRGVVREGEDFITDTGRVFPYRGFLMKDRVDALLSTSDEVVIKGNSPPSIIFFGLFSLKQQFVDKLRSFIPEPHAGLAVGILLGVKNSLGEVLSEAFRISGLLHIVVLSGYNITLVVELVRRLSRPLGRRTSFFLSIAMIVAFVAMIGFNVPAIRAGVMALLALVAFHLNLQFLAIRGLFLVFGLFVVVQPYSLLFDTSLHLSTFATLGLLLLANPLQKKLRRLPVVVSGIIAATLSTYIFVAPYLLYITGVLSTVTLPANIIALPFVPFAMLGSFLVGVVGFVSEPIALLISQPTLLLLEIIISVATISESITLSSFTVPEFPLWAMAGVYGLYSLLLLRAYK